MRFQLVSKSVTLNDLVRRNGHYFALFHRIRQRCRRKTIIHRFQNLLLAVYDNLRNHSAIIWAKQTLITPFGGRRCIDD